MIMMILSTFYWSMMKRIFLIDSVNIYHPMDSIKYHFKNPIETLNFLNGNINNCFLVITEVCLNVQIRFC
jgi:hypothetical protein